MIQDAFRFLSGRRSRQESHRQQSDAQLRIAAVKRREAVTRANVGLSRAIGTTIIVSPLAMAGQPGACIVTAVLHAGLIVDTTAYGKSRQPLVPRFAQIKTWSLASMDNVWPISFACGVVLAGRGV